MKITKKRIALCIVVLAAFGVGTVYYLSGRAASVPGRPVSAGTVEQKELKSTISLKAPLEGTESVEILSSLHYEVLSINVKEGDKVQKRQVLAVLDSSSLKEDIAVLENAARLLELQNKEKLSTQQREYENAKAKLASAREDYEKTKILVEAEAKTKTELEEQERAVRDCQAVLDAYPAVDGRVVTDESTLKSIEAAWKEAERKSKALEECEIKSSIDGTVTRVNVKVGRFADETEDNKPMFIVENIDSLKMKLMVSEYDIGKVQAGQDVTVTADILGNETIAARVARISPTGELKSGGTSERVVPVEVEILEHNGKLLAGITARATIELAKSENALSVPSEAILEKEEGSFAVYRITDENTVEIIPVVLGIESDLEAEVITDRLSRGDVIILNPALDIQEGETVMTGAAL